MRAVVLHAERRPARRGKGQARTWPLTGAGADRQWRHLRLRPALLQPWRLRAGPSARADDPRSRDFRACRGARRRCRGSAVGRDGRRQSVVALRPLRLLPQRPADPLFRHVLPRQRDAHAARAGRVCRLHRLRRRQGRRHGCRRRRRDRPPPPAFGATGAREVVVTDILDKPLALAPSLGADHTVNVGRSGRMRWPAMSPTRAIRRRLRGRRPVADHRPGTARDTAAQHHRARRPGRRPRTADLDHRRQGTGAARQLPLRRRVFSPPSSLVRAGSTWRRCSARPCRSLMPMTPSCWQATRAGRSRYRSPSPERSRRAAIAFRRATQAAATFREVGGAQRILSLAGLSVSFDGRKTLDTMRLIARTAKPAGAPLFPNSKRRPPCPARNP